MVLNPLVKIKKDLKSVAKDIEGLKMTPTEADEVMGLLGCIAEYAYPIVMKDRELQDKKRSFALGKREKETLH